MCRRKMTQNAFEKEKMASASQGKQLARTPEPHFPKNKQQSHQSKSRHERETEPKLGENKREHGEDRVSFTVKEGGFHERDGGQAKRTSFGKVEESMSG